MRSHYCGQLNEQHVGQEVSLCGWAHRRRDHGGVIFVDLRDREGIVQVVFDPDRAESFALAESVRSEFVLQIKGLVRLRPAGTSNAEMGTGRIEVLAKELVVLSAAKTPPFLLDEHTEVGEDIRLRHRYIDLRRPEMAGVCVSVPRSATPSATIWMTMVSLTSRRQFSRVQLRRVPVTIWFPAVPIRAVFLHCRNHRSSSNRF